MAERPTEGKLAERRRRWSRYWLITNSIHDCPDNVFKCGISVAPPTDWLFYDTIYTERFMGLPTEDDNLVLEPYF